MKSNLELIILDIEEVLSDLKVYWLDNEEYSYNPNAFDGIKDSGDNIMCCCPFHVERNPSFGIQKSYPYTSYCFQCGIGWSLPQLIQHVCGLSTEAHAEHFIMKNYSNLSVKEKRPSIDIEGILDRKDRDKKVSHLNEELAKYVGKRHPYLYSRGFSERTLAKYEVGYDEYSQSMIIPIRTSQGNIRFFKRRSVEYKTFLNEKNLYKKDIVFGMYYLIQAMETVPEIYLNESETDCLSMYQGKFPAGALMGRILFDEQIKELLKAGVKEVHLMLDNDSAGVKGCLNAYEKLSRYPIRVNKVIYPGANFGIDTLDETEAVFKDANDVLLANKMSELQIIDFLTFLNRLSRGGYRSEE